MRLALFSPLPPSTSGIAAYTAELLPGLRAHAGTVDVFVDRPPLPGETGVHHACDFIWMRRRAPYDLVIYQLGNAACHDYMWAYLFRYPGLVTLHDAQLHQARALWLTRRWQPRREDYLAEFRACHPGAPGEIGELVAAGLGDGMYQLWPMLRLVLERARLVVVHGAALARTLAEEYPGIAIEAVEMGVADPLETPGGLEALDREAAAFRGELGIPPDAIVVGAFGGLTPEKRLGPLLRAASALRDRLPHLHVLLAGARASHFDVDAEAARWDVADRVHVSGFVPDERLGAAMRATDVCACLRWPTNRETSASWLRCLGAARATIVTDLVHLTDVPTMTPAGPRAGAGTAPPIAMAIDILDEQHALELAIDRLAGDERLRARLGDAARAWWEGHHRLDRMTAAYAGLIERAARLEPAVTNAALPFHLRDDGTGRAKALLATFGQDTTWLG
ncbi:MAG: glycosyltransferase family 4 protein [Vicinamibacterales bacterium]